MIAKFGYHADSLRSQMWFMGPVWSPTIWSPWPPIMHGPMVLA